MVDEEKIWDLLLKYSCFGNFDCLINPDNPNHKEKQAKHLLKVMLICPYWEECWKEYQLGRTPKNSLGSVLRRVKKKQGSYSK